MKRKDSRLCPYFYSIELKTNLSKIILVPDIAFFLLKNKFKYVCDIICIVDIIEVKTFIISILDEIISCTEDFVV